ncbi:hypothetical protein EJB05_27723, partial [Eragrostis curvula]
MILYATTADAEAALVTWAEATWFRYSAAMPDHWLSFHNTLILLVIHTLIPLPLLLFEYLAPAVAQRYKVQPQVRLSLTTFIRCYRDSAHDSLPIMGHWALSFLLYTLCSRYISVWDFLLPSAGEILAQLLVYLLVEDYLNYWIHRLLHTKWAYNNIHHVLHEFTAPEGFIATYSLG